MAQLLLHIEGRGPADDRSDYCPGDVVFIAEDDHKWGRMEHGAHTPFFIVKLPGIKASTIRRLAREKNVVESMVVTVEPEQCQRMECRREHHLNFDGLPDKVVRAMEEGIEVELLGADRKVFLNAYEVDHA